MAAAFSVALAAGVWHGLAEVRPPRPKAKATVATCADDLGALRQELLARLASLATASSAALEGRSYEGWAVSFRGRVASARQRCSPPAESTLAEARSVDTAFRALLRSVDLSEVQATHWSRHLGPALDEAAAAIDETR